jgi:hypothetical protein
MPRMEVFGRFRQVIWYFDLTRRIVLFRALELMREVYQGELHNLIDLFRNTRSAFEQGIVVNGKNYTCTQADDKFIYGRMVKSDLGYSSYDILLIMYV